MKDTQLRGLLLEAFYRRRREDFFVPNAEEIGAKVGEQDILQVCDQLAQHRMIKWKSLGSPGNIEVGVGKISAFGIDVIENVATPDINVEFVQNQTVNISDSTNVVVGNNNSQVVTQTVRNLISIIESSDSPNEQKTEAKSLLRRFLEHPLLTAVAAGAIGLLR